MPTRVNVRKRFKLHVLIGPSLVHQLMPSNWRKDGKFGGTNAPITSILRKTRSLKSIVTSSRLRKLKTMTRLYSKVYESRIHSTREPGEGPHLPLYVAAQAYNRGDHCTHHQHSRHHYTFGNSPSLVVFVSGYLAIIVFLCTCE